MDYEPAIEHVRSFKAYCEASLAIQSATFTASQNWGNGKQAAEGTRSELPFVELIAQDEATHLAPLLRAPDMVIENDTSSSQAARF